MTTDVPTFTVAELEAVPAFDVPSFDNGAAVALGKIAIDVIVETERNLAVDIVVADDLVFRAKLGTTGAGNDQWLAGKAATARRFAEPSLLVRRRREEAGQDPADHSTDTPDMKIYGGAIPIFVAGELVGTITMSGEADNVDHATVAEAVARFLAELRG
jgi:uncharacterized protein (UPF0303 family)